MPPLNWDRLQDVDLEKLEESEVEDWYHELLAVKASQAQVAIEEVDQLASDKAKIVAEREEELTNEIDDLKQQLSALRRHTADANVSKEAQPLKDEIRFLTEENQRLERDFGELRRDIAHEKEVAGRYASRVEQYEKEIRDLRKERDQLIEDVRESQRQLETQRETLTNRRAEGEDLQKKMRNRNQEMIHLVDEVNNLTEANEALQKQVQELKGSLEESVRQMEKTTDQYARMKEALKEADDAVEVLQSENTELQRKLAELGIRSPEQPTLEEELMKAVDKKIEEWKDLFQEKDRELANAKKQIEELNHEITQYQMDSDRTNIVALTKAVEDRDQTIQALRNEMQTYTSEMERNALVMEELRTQLNMGGSVSETQKQRMYELQKNLKNKDHLASESVKRAADAEQHALDRDKQLAELLSRMRQYESKEFGLAEAVDEVRATKLQLDIREKQNEELVQHCSKLEIHVTELLDENEELRERLGLDKHKPLSVAFKHTRRVERETERALNVILQKEIERLEDERVELKLQMRKLAQRLGERAVALGLSADDLMVIDQFAEDLKKGRRRKSPEQRPTSPGQKIDASSKSDFEKLRRDNKDLRTKVAQLETENVKMLQGLKEIRAQLIDGTLIPGNTTLVTPTLDKLVAALEARELTGNLDAVMQMKSQLDTLTGGHTELRLELRESRVQLQKSLLNLHESEQKNARLTEQINKLKEKSAAAYQYQTFALPEGIPPTSAMAIMNLNEQLIQIMQELSLKTDQLKRLEESTEIYRRKISLLKHQQSLLYKQYIDEKKVYTEDKEKTAKIYADMEATFQTSQTQIAQFERLMDTLTQDENEVKRRLGEMTRKYTVMTINEKVMIRKYNTALNSEEEYRKEIEAKSREMLDIENAITEKIGYFERQKEITSYQTASLHKTLENSVPSSDYETLSRQNTELAEKYRRLMENENKLLSQQTNSAQNEMERQQFKRENELLKRQLQTEKEKSNKLELLIEAGRLSGIASPANWNLISSDTDSGFGSISELHSVSQKLAMLEMKELNERQKAEHVNLMFEQQKEQLRLLEHRNSELETKFDKLTLINVDIQKIEQNLRDELANCVPKATFEGEKQKANYFEKLSVEQKNELEKMREIFDVAKNQYNYLQQNVKTQNIELNELRDFVREMQAESDQKALIGRLHREIVKLKLKDTSAEFDLKSAKEKIVKLEVSLRRSRQQADDNRRSLDHFRLEFVHRVQQLRKTINELRHRFTGAVPLDEQEKFNSLLTKMKQEKEKLRDELIQASNKEAEASAKLDELELRQVGLEELIVTIKDNKGAQKLTEWHRKMEECQLNEMKVKRQLVRLEHQDAMQNNVIITLENTVTTLETENIWQEREIAWEQRENELESKIRNFEMEERYADKQLEEFDPDITELMDGSVTLVEQVTRTTHLLKKRVHSEKVLKRELERMRKDLDQITADKKRLEADLFRKDRLILDLRKLIPENISRQFASSIDANLPLIGIVGETFERFDFQQAAKIMLETSEQTFQARLQHKDQALDNYRQLLHSVQLELSETRRSHQEEIAKMLAEISQLEADKLTKWRDEANRLVFSSDEQTETEKHILRIAELEDTNFEYENRITNLVEKLNEITSERDRLKFELETLKKQINAGTAIAIPGLFPPHPTEGGGSRPGSLKRPDSAHTTKRPGSGATIRSDHKSVKTVTEHHEESFVVIQEVPEPAPDGIAEVVETIEKETEKIKSRRSSVASDGGKTVGGDESQIIDISQSTVVRTTTRSIVPPTPAVVQSESESYLKMKVECQKWKRKFKEKDLENKQLTQVVGTLKNDMLLAAGQPKRTRPDSDSGMKELEMKELKLKLEEVEEKFTKQRQDLKNSKTKGDELRSEIQELSGEISRKDSIISKLKSDKEKLEKEIDNLEKRLNHLRESVKLKLLETENNELKKRLAVLERRLESEQKIPPEKPTDSLPENKTETLLEWEKKKDLERKVAKYKEHLNAKTKENEEQQKIIGRLRNRITRLEQEKAMTDSDSRFGGSTRGKQSVAVDSIASQMWELEKQEMQYQIDHQKSLIEKYANIDEQNKLLKSRKDFLEEKCTALERALLQLHASQSISQNITEINDTTTLTILGPEVDTNGKNTKELEDIIAMLRRLLEQAYKDRERFKSDFESANKDFQEEKHIGDRLRNRIKELQTEMENVQQEMEELRDDVDQAERGYKYEIVNRLHAKVEQLEFEKTELLQQIDEVKFNSSRISDPDIQRLIRENRQLKKLARAAPRVAWSEHLTPESRSETVTKLIGDNDALRRDLRRTENECGRLRRDLEIVKIDKEKIEQELRNAQLIVERRRRWQPVTIEPRSPAYGREDTVLRQKTERIYELENLLKVEIEKNQTLLYENKRLTIKIKALEWTPTKEHSTDDLLRQIRQLKSELVRLETEHGHLQDELEMFSKRIEPVFDGKSDFDLVTFKERMKIYDRVLHENIDLKLENNGLKAKKLKHL